MDIHQLRYVVEIARTGSISKAAKNLYMGQPNLSKSLRELENETGLTLFRRTAKGMTPTQSGADFIGHARSIVSQMDNLETMYIPDLQNETVLSVCAPRASYIAHAFSQYAKDLQGQIQLQYHETNAENTIGDVGAGAAGLGIVRYKEQDTAHYESLIRRAGLRQQLLWKFDMLLLLHEYHPLAGLTEIPYHLLADYPELVHGDFFSPQPLIAQKRSAQISVFDRAAQFELLRAVSGSYMWVSPMPFAVLSRQDLLQKPCQHTQKWCDVAIFAKTLNAQQQAFLQYVSDMIESLRSFT